jgi:lysyl-tRNA synthetase class 2
MLEDIIKNKLSKLDNIRSFGMEPYPEKTGKSISNGEALEKLETLSDKEIILAGRVRSLRPMGGSAFAHIEDESGKIQLFLNKKNIEESKFKLFISNIEVGDFVEAKGKLFKTKQDEKTLQVSDWKILSKIIRPVPTEYYGIKDQEDLLRKRYLDLMLNPETRELFRKKNIFWQTIRSFLLAEKFLEVQTPVLEHIPGGAEAEPFVTHYNALDEDLYLRISLELALKRLLVGGYEKVFEIGRVFRNEGMDRDHLQEFDFMEFYASYWDLQKGIEFTEKLYKEIVLKVLGGYEHGYDHVKSADADHVAGGYKINWEKEFPKVDYFDAFQKAVGIDLGQEVSVDELQKKATELKIKFEKTAGKGRLIDLIYKKTIRPNLIQPCFLVGHPIEVSPLAKIDPKNPKKVLRFQIVAGGSELCNAFAELNDPIDQRERFEAQAKLREAGDAEAQMMDGDFVEALEYGMPPAFGFGMSERFFAFLQNKSIRETIIFPPMKTK